MPAVVVTIVLVTAIPGVASADVTTETYAGDVAQGDCQYQFVTTTEPGTNDRWAGSLTCGSVVTAADGRFAYGPLNVSFDTVTITVDGVSRSFTLDKQVSIAAAGDDEARKRIDFWRVFAEKVENLAGSIGGTVSGLAQASKFSGQVFGGAGEPARTEADLARARW
jgi:hypothetical protein